MSLQRFDPTHTLVLTTSGDATAEATVTAAAVEAVLDNADAVTLHLDPGALTSDHPELAEQLRAATEQVDDGVLRAPVDRVHDPLADLLDLTDAHRFVTLERLDASRDGRQLLHYVPDHTTFEADATAAEGVVDAVSRAVADQPAGLLPTAVLADWDADGTRYELAPPSLCVDGGTCFGLGALDRIAFDDGNHTIRLTWATGDGLLATAGALLGPNRPGRFKFDSPNRYAAVTDAFETVADALEVEVEKTERR
ncbi:hypothetical protein [Haloarchaeobius iranensis]|uniref:Uncharacterized protein n=1 Tax=Haloarchaeobius iranensis TaxID=996166 RepID=A0A1H0AX36_9EURY|nr:hypothetical protein [Haloarchaeobius iranensis]SDN37965.1 hypothetical protein SAMN05192554_1313 [Haloarchaeobius iranensis]